MCKVQRITHRHITGQNTKRNRFNSVDDTLMEGNSVFLDLKEKDVKVFEHKPRVILSKNTPLQFKGMNIEMDDDYAISLNMSDHTKR